jgi:hypothetical protein
MKPTLAFIVTNKKYKNHIIQLMESAFKAGYNIKCFIMDEGVLLTEDATFVSKVILSNTSVSICEYSCNVNGIEKRVEAFNYASQFENAKMIHDLLDFDRLLKF